MLHQRKGELISTVALTYLYEGYYDVWLGGKYFLRVAEMHKEYGPIVRITPHEVHFADPEFLDALYPVSGRKIDKPSWFALLTGSKYLALCLMSAKLTIISSILYRFHHSS